MSKFKQIFKTVLFWFISCFVVSAIFGMYNPLPESVQLTIFWLTVLFSWLVPFFYYKKKETV